MLAAIPYTTFPTIELGPLNLRTFGLMVALGVLVGSWIAAAYGERFGVSRDETYRVATWMVLAGIVGSRLTWAATHTDQIENPVDVIAIWEGGIQFSGGFICALIVGLPFFRRWSRVLRWRLLDGYALGFSLGLALGRVGCYAVGEHFGRTTDFFLASRYDGGEVREPTLGDEPLVVGTTFHNTSLYEFLYLVVLFGLLGGLVLAARRRGRDVSPGTLVGVFTLVYGVCRLISDSFRVNDERVAGMTGAQWMCLVMVAAGAWILVTVRPRLAALDAGEVAAETAPDELAAPDDDAEGEGDGDASSGTAGAGAAAGDTAGEAGEAREGERWRTAATKMSALLDPAPGAAASAPAADGSGGAGDADGSGDRTEDGAAEGDRGDAGDERS
ncbi:MAG TPA: prolipoprotein diacylglyceryl transferase family protein [Acidimicrobiales bacterium]